MVLGDAGAQELARHAPLFRIVRARLGYLQRKAQPVTDEVGFGNATVGRMLIGARLRQLREEKAISRVEAGYTIRASESKMSRLETGRVSFKERDVNDLLMLYGVTDPDERDCLLDLVRQANQPGWWRDFDDVMPGWVESYIGLEEAASTLRTYETHFVPGLLQTPDYARAVLASGMPPLQGHDLDRGVELRLRRQRVLSRSNPLRIWAVVEEAALLRLVGSEDVHRRQLEHLLEMTARPHISVQLLPVANSAHALGGGAFSILRFEDHAVPDVVYVEQLTGATYVDKFEHVSKYAEVMTRLGVESLTPEASADHLAKLLADP